MSTDADRFDAPSGLPDNPDDGSAVAAALLRVTTALPGGGEVRDGQREMAAAVSKAIVNSTHLIVQAGTGTGKSLGYLVPAIISGATVVVSTATKALQDQLATKDLPFLAKHLGVPFTFALLKGRSNYFCLQKASELQGPKQQMQLLDDGEGAGRRFDGDKVMEQIDQLVDWAQETEVGDRAELPFEPLAPAWSAVSVSAGECPGAAKCPNGESCFAEKARARAADANVIVVNTHLYGQHVRSGGYVLPEHDVVVFDEAHEVEDIMADSFGVEISAGRFAFLASRLRQVVVDGDSAVELVDAGTQLESALTPYSGLRLTRGPGAEEPIRAALVTAIQRVNKAMSLLRQIDDNAPGGLGPKKVRAVQAASGLADELLIASELGATVRKPRSTMTEADIAGGAAGHPASTEPSETASEEDRVAWVEPGSSTRGPILRIAPIEVAPTLAATTWNSTTAILTSATIPSNLGQRLGLVKDSTDTLDVGSPFDYAHQGLLYCAVNLPDPRSSAFETASHKELRALMEAAGGRTLALFTSWKAMRAAAEALNDAKPKLPFRILTQSDLPKPALVKAFTEDETSCLLATMGFWQGIDVPGRALSLVIIDKLPFARPDEPLLVARRERVGDAAFRLIDLPRASMMLAQGVGRLIRTSTDRGVVAVLDPRLNTAKSYRYDLIRALPPMRRSRDLAEVCAFLKAITG
jgi:ATP-dependent DNA helicase DinG